MTKILIIDDDEKLSRLVQLFLSQHGYEVHTASSGLQGLQLAYDLHPDLVVLDIMMPGMDGWVVCSRLRDVSDVPIIMLTAKDGERNVVEGLESGADDYVVKPFSMAELLARIRREREEAKRAWQEVRAGVAHNANHSNRPGGLITHPEGSLEIDAVPEVSAAERSSGAGRTLAKSPTSEGPHSSFTNPVRSPA